MRVIAGSQKGRRLKGPVGNQVRPTPERVREALFSILADQVKQAAVVDLCCGTGTIGLEALSRGARCVVFVDRAQNSLALLKKNLELCGNPKEAIVLASDAWQVRKMPRFIHSAPYDIIYIDPPYAQENLSPLIRELSNKETLSPQGSIIVEHFWKTDMPSSVESLQQSRTARYGDTMLTFYQRTSEPHANRRISRNI